MARRKIQPKIPENNQKKKHKQPGNQKKKEKTKVNSGNEAVS